MSNGNKIAALCALLLLAALACGATVIGEKHGLQTWGMSTDTWIREELGPDSKIFVLDAGGNPVPGAAYSKSKDGTQVLIVPYNEVEQLLRHEHDGDKPEPESKPKQAPEPGGAEGN